jgi:hypothetical protein
MPLLPADLYEKVNATNRVYPTSRIVYTGIWRAATDQQMQKSFPAGFTRASPSPAEKLVSGELAT